MRISADGCKVYLRSLAMEDADAIQRNADDIEVAGSVASAGYFPHPYTKADALQFIQMAVGLYPLMTALHMGVCIMGTDELIGACGLSEIDSASKRAAIGYWIGRAHWGKGYGKGAAQLMVSYALESLGLNRVHCRVFESNGRSIGLLKSLGFREEGRLREHDLVGGKFADSMVFGVLKNEFKPLNLKITD